MFKSLRENDKLQLIAHQRLYRYYKEVLEPKTEKQTSICKQRIQNREKMIQNRDKTIQDREKTIKKKETLISKQNDTLHIIRKDREKLIRISALFHPIKKYKAYKNLLKQISLIKN